jgi:hypothetical protein
MERKQAQLFVAVVAALILLTGLFVLTANEATSPARADTVPTPVANMNQSPESALVTFSAGTTPTIADAGTDGMQLYTFEYCNLQWITDQTLVAGAYNTTTLTVNWSMDNSTWSDGPVIIASNVSDADGVVQVPNLGRYMRIYKDVTSANPITITVKGVCK